ncbi:hypothetical protein B0A54_03910 [Friedmanniomyces endolithicus]|uniref:F-box domain-containing protein n=1 Tax=Friedmanniomyces endolithicus TaxID=329885 RepID=A0A4U0VDA8_9PEZI|nr:hypothetical protein LTS09_002935 [Friedmanniomyces endolithicus]TKA46954.1 hypothetical protein B0A54_03910 [Friedmanniomyces endolithicus]
MLGPNTQDDTTCTRRRSSSAITISSLPPELLLLITDYLPVSAIVSLKLTSNHLYHATPLPKAYHAKPAFHALPLCEQRALRRNLDEAADLATGRRQCLLCNCLLHLRFFPNDGATCDLHSGRYMSTSLPPGLDAPTKARLERLAGFSQEAYWVAISRQLCIHTGRVVRWDVPACECGCDSCAHVSVVCYIRISHSSLRPSGWWLRSDHDGNCWVQEYDAGAGSEASFRPPTCEQESKPSQLAVLGESPGVSRPIPVVSLQVAEKTAGTRSLDTLLV